MSQPSYVQQVDIRPIYIVSCGEGINGELLVQSALVQFPGSKAVLIKVPHVRHLEQLEDVIEEAARTGGIIVHTLVDPELRKSTAELCAARGVTAIDLMGPLLLNLSEILGREPVCEPGRYRKFHQVDLDRIAAIEFSMLHDDGMNPKTLDQSEIVLVGVSRVGKTPLSIYLSVLGWKVANVPIVGDAPLSAEVASMDPRRVFGLIISEEQLVAHRKIRQTRLGITSSCAYCSRMEITRELEFSYDLFRRHRFTVIDVTNKPVESSAEEVITRITRRLRTQAHLR